MSILDNLSFQFTIDLFNVRLQAESRQDRMALLQLKTSFPEIFSKRIEKFVEEYNFL